tara:strand:+ start:280 stop:501 length:222 start_codon:yes stop_codon:yes gene_type:complete
MAHLHFIKDTNGYVVDAVVFCSDLCHREYCDVHDGGYDIDLDIFNKAPFDLHKLSTSEPCAYCEGLVNAQEGN